MHYRINWKASDKTVVLGVGENAPPAAIAGRVDLGTFEHGPTDDDDTQLQLPGFQDYPDNHVLYHHVQEALYHQGFTDMSLVKITFE